MTSLSGITEKYSDALQIIAVLASADVFKLFVCAERGVVLSPSLLEQLRMTKKQYYKALHRLRLLGLLEKRDGIYSYTISGNILYNQVVRQIVQLSKHQSDLKIIEILKNTGQFSDDEIRKFIDKIIKDNRLLSVPAASNIITSYEAMVKILRERVELANDEILIATRISSDELIASLIDSIKLGVRVRILIDERLVEKYHRAYDRKMERSDSYLPIGKHEDERVRVVENPWYLSGLEMERRVGKIPFGLIVFDRSEAGIELVDSYNPDNFTAGILVKNSQIGEAMFKLYEEMWSNSRPI
jgi:predicted transcriptional regulator